MRRFFTFVTVAMLAVNALAFGRWLHGMRTSILKQSQIVAHWDFNNFDPNNQYSSNVCKAVVGGDGIPCVYWGKGTAEVTDGTLESTYVIWSGYEGFPDPNPHHESAPAGTNASAVACAATLKNGNCALAIDVSRHIKLPLPTAVTNGTGWAMTVRFWRPSVGQYSKNYNSFFNLMPNNTDGDLFIRPSLQLGGGQFPGYNLYVTSDEWHEITILAFTDHWCLYLDGVQNSYAENANICNWLKDQQYLLLCADEDQEDGLLFIDDVKLYSLPDPREVGGSAYGIAFPQLWFDAADTSTMTFTDATHISAWDSKGFVPAHATSSDSVYPSYATTNNLHFVDFGPAGTLCDLAWGTRENCIKTCIFVQSITVSQAIFWLGDSSYYTFHRGSNGEYGTSSYGYVQYANTYCDGVQVDPVADCPPTGFHIFTMVLTGAQGFSATQICEDRDLADIGRIGGKQVMEIITFNRALSETERKQIENRLSRKWGIPVQ